MKLMNLISPAQQGVELRQGFFSFYDELWNLINLRNDIQHFQSGLFVLDIPTFSERVVREAVLNAVSHRDYQLGGSVFIRQHPQYSKVQTAFLLVLPNIIFLTVNYRVTGVLQIFFPNTSLWNAPGRG